MLSLQVDKDTMEMLKSIGMGSLPGLSLPSVRLPAHARTRRLSAHLLHPIVVPDQPFPYAIRSYMLFAEVYLQLRLFSCHCSWMVRMVTALVHPLGQVVALEQPVTDVTWAVVCLCSSTTLNNAKPCTLS